MFDARRYVLVGFLSLISFFGTAQLNADFSADTLFGCGSLSVQFTDQSSGAITSRSWDFGNGNSSTVTNPLENFGVGTYTIRLTVSDGSSSDTETKVAYIRVFSEPISDFTFSPASGCTPLPVSFTDNSTAAGGAIQDYVWDLDDGNQGPNQANFTHTYQGGGPFQPSLQVIDVNGCSDSKQSTTNVTPTPSPVASFNTLASPVGCVVPFNVDFVNNSTGVNLSYQWNFGDGNTSTQANPSHTYTSLGNYTVRLIISDPNCSDTLIRTNYIRVNSTDADFSFPNDTVCFGEPVSFTNLSLGATSFSWDFDDGTPLSFVQEPTHIFNDSGWFDVRLVASLGSSCTDQIIRQIYVQRVIADFALSDTLGCDLPDTIQFINTSSNAFGYEWRIADLDSNLDPKVFRYDSILSPFHIIRKEGPGNDTLIAFTEFGCSDITVKNIRIRDTIDVDIEVTGSLGTFNGYEDCVPFTVQFSDTTFGPGNSFFYSWIIDGDTINSRVPPPRNYDTAGFFNISLTVRNEDGCESTDIAPIVADTIGNPDFIVFPDTVCAGDSLIIEVLNDSANSILRGAKYTFGIFTANDARGYIEELDFRGFFNVFKDTGYYSASVMVGELCDTSLIIDSAFYVKGPVSDLNARGNCLFPDSIELTSGALGYTRFYWDFGDGSPIDSVNINPTHFYATDTIFKVTLTLINDTNGCPPLIDSTFIDLIPRLAAQNLPYRNNNCKGDDIRLYLNNSFYDSTEWFINGNLLGNFEDSTFEAGVLPKGISDVWMVGTNALGCKDTVFDYLAVSDLEIGLTATNNTGCAPLNVILNDNSSNNMLNIIYEWFFSDLPNDTLMGPTVNRNIIQSATIDVRLKVTDSIRCTADTFITGLISTSNPVIDFITNQSTSICQGDTIQFFNRSSGNQLTNIWDWRDGTRDTTNNLLVTHQFDSAGVFNIRLVVEDNSGCRDTLERYTINVEGSPVAAFTADTTQASCYPLAVNFSDTSSGNINQWIWNLGSADSIVVQNPFRNFIRPGNFDVSLIVFTPNGCSDTLIKQDYIQITGPTAAFSITPDTACLNEAVVFSVDSTDGVGEVRWAFGDGNGSTNDPATHIYTDTVGLIKPSLIISDVLGNCEVFLRDSLTILNVIADFEVSDTIGCQPFRPNIVNLMQGADNFSWDFGDGRTSSDQDPDLIYEQAGNFNLNLRVSNNNGCTDEKTVQITVLPKPTAEIIGNDFLCAGESLNLSGSGGNIIGWYLDGDSLTSSTNINISPDSSLTVAFVIENNQNCRDTAIQEVFVQQPPNYLPQEDSTIIIGEVIEANVGATQGFVYNWVPDYGLSCDDCPDPRMQPLRSTTYLLTIADSLGCFSITDTIRIEVIEEFSLEVPQAFSPNGDGVNDVVFAEGWGLKNLIAFKIFNRFGELVFESNQFEKGWDGTYNGQDQMVETYVYTVEAETFGGEVLVRKGNLTLIR